MKRVTHYFIIILGVASSISFIVNYFIFAELQPKMIRFEIISQKQENLLLITGLGLLIFLAFCLFSLLRILQYLKKAKKITPVYLLLLITGVLSFLFVFSDLALLNDISKQYKLGLDQPEWSLVYPIMIFQFFTAVAFTSSHFLGFKKENQTKYIKNNNTFIIVQIIGLFCGLIGLTSSSLGLFFPRGWNLLLHTTIGSLVLLMPYFLIVFYWLLLRLKEKTKKWYNIQDIGKSSFMTLITSIIFMVFLFVLKYNNLDGIIRMLWLPLYIFFVLTLFSFGNLYFKK